MARGALRRGAARGPSALRGSAVPRRASASHASALLLAAFLAAATITAALGMGPPDQDPAPQPAPPRSGLPWTVAEALALVPFHRAAADYLGGGAANLPSTAEALPLAGRGRVSPPALALFLSARNPALDLLALLALAGVYAEECAAEGIDHDIAFAQMCLETGYLSFGGLVDLSMHNYCGLGSIDEARRGESFPDARRGVRAQVQHLKAYADGLPLARSLVDPRFRFVARGSAPTLADLAGKWASDPEYAVKIAGLVALVRGLEAQLRDICIVPGPGLEY